jgi:hypothetical protein
VPRADSGAQLALSLTVQLDSPYLLDPHLSVLDVADDARAALAAFLALEPDRTSLVAWLVGPHAHALRGTNGRNPVNVEALPPDRLLFDVVRLAQHAGRDLSMTVATGGVEALVGRLPNVVDVVRVVDVFDARGFAPRGSEGIALTARIVSLIVADVLTRPDQFGPRREEPLGEGAVIPPRQSFFGVPSHP